MIPELIARLLTALLEFVRRRMLNVCHEMQEAPAESLRSYGTRFAFVETCLLQTPFSTVSLK